MAVKNSTDKTPPKIFPIRIGLFIANIAPRKITKPHTTLTIIYLNHFGILGLFIRSAINGSILTPLFQFFIFVGRSVYFLPFPKGNYTALCAKHQNI